jgi:hypothetical protein
MRLVRDLVGCTLAVGGACVFTVASAACAVVIVSGVLLSPRAGRMIW